MTAEDILIDVRYRLRDQQSAKISDSSLLSFLNHALSLLHEHFATFRSSLGRAVATIALTNGVGDLPADFRAIITVEGGGDILTPTPTSGDLDGENYRIVGMQIRAPYSSLTIEYHKEHARCTAPTTTISLPIALQSVLTDATWYLALGNRAAASQLLYGVAKQQSSRGVSELPETKMLIGG